MTDQHKPAAGRYDLIFVLIGALASYVFCISTVVICSQTFFFNYYFIPNSANERFIHLAIDAVIGQDETLLSTISSSEARNVLFDHRAEIAENYTIQVYDTFWSEYYYYVDFETGSRFSFILLGHWRQTHDSEITDQDVLQNTHLDRVEYLGRVKDGSSIE